jgi:transposase
MHSAREGWSRQNKYTGRDHQKLILSAGEEWRRKKADKRSRKADRKMQTCIYSAWEERRQ